MIVTTILHACTKKIYLLRTCDRLLTWQACPWGTKNKPLADHTLWLCRACPSTRLQFCREDKLDVPSCLNWCLQCRDRISWRALPIWLDNFQRQPPRILPCRRTLGTSRGHKYKGGPRNGSYCLPTRTNSHRSGWTKLARSRGLPAMSPKQDKKNWANAYKAQLKQKNNNILTSQTRRFEMNLFLSPTLTWAVTHWSEISTGWSCNWNLISSIAEQTASASG